MAIESCSAKEQYSVLQCMKATAAHVDDWEKHSRLGIEADDLQQVIARWPSIDDRDEASHGHNRTLTEYLGRMFVQKQMVVAEMLSAHLPMEVFGLKVERKGIGHKRVQHAGKVLHIFGRESVGNNKPGSLRFLFMNKMSGHREAPQGNALGCPEWNF
jgi:hypothetical protein